MKTIPRTLVAIGILATAAAFAHSGGTNAAGCHTNSRTGDYHCHNPKPRVQNQINYCHVTVEGERRCGYALSSCQSLVRQFGGTCQLDL